MAANPTRTISSGGVFIVGAGPGDPDLLTRKACRLLEQADVVLYDRLVSDEILDLAKPSAELVYVGKHEGRQEEIQSAIFGMMEAYARAGRTVVRLKGGDPMVFGRGAEEWQYLAERGIAVEVVPGITSAISVPGLAGIPVTHRNLSRSFTVITGHTTTGLPEEWARYAGIDTLVILMGVQHRAIIAQALIAAGRRPDEPIAFIENGSTPNERVTTATLAEVAEGRVEASNPAVFVIGEVVRVRQQTVGRPVAQAVEA